MTDQWIGIEVLCLLGKNALRGMKTKILGHQQFICRQIKYEVYNVFTKWNQLCWWNLCLENRLVVLCL